MIDLKLGGGGGGSYPPCFLILKRDPDGLDSKQLKKLRIWKLELFLAG